MIDCVLIQEGWAHEIFSGREKKSLVFHPDVMAQIVEVDAGAVVEGDRWDGQGFVKPVVSRPAPEPPRRSRIEAAIAILIDEGFFTEEELEAKRDLTEKEIDR